MESYVRERCSSSAPDFEQNFGLVSLRFERKRRTYEDEGEL